MESRNSALLLLLLGAFCSCASAYYFPNGPPHRPSRQALPPGLSTNDTVIPEPKQLLPIPPPSDNGTNSSGILTFDTPLPKYSHQKDEDKPEPRHFPGIQMVPKSKETNPLHRQSNSCQQNYAFSASGQTVQLQSPNYNRDYPNNVDSSICFSSPSGTTMKVSCDDFNVEYAQSCAYDFFGIGYGGSPSSVQKYCGRGTLNSPNSSGNSLAIVFKSDSTNPGALRRTPYRFRCTISVSGSGSGSPSTTTAAPAPPPASGDCNCGARNAGSRIVGGQDSKVNEFPHRCYLKTDSYDFFCGCSVISNKWILTAAHCTKAVTPLNGDTLYVVVGDHDRSISTDTVSQQIAVDKIVDHERYDDRTMDNDVSLLSLSQPLTFNNRVSPICLPFNYANDDFSGTTITTSGWGRTREGGQVSNTLKNVDIPVLTTAQCARYYPGQITDNMICTYQPSKDTCQGDSGGSIDLLRNGRYYHIGVVSWGIGCARENYPGVYAKTTKYLDWIKTNSGDTFCVA